MDWPGFLLANRRIVALRMSSKLRRAEKVNPGNRTKAVSKIGPTTKSGIRCSSSFAQNPTRRMAMIAS